MIDIDLAQATFEYIVRKKINDGELPTDRSYIFCDEHYYIVHWEEITIQQLWDKLVDKKVISNAEEDNLESIFNDIIETFIDNLLVIDPAVAASKKKLRDLSYWYFVRNIPKKYLKS